MSNYGLINGTGFFAHHAFIATDYSHSIDNYILNLGLLNYLMLESIFIAPASEYYLVNSLLSLL
jgi:hypothetical protein